VVVVVVVVVVVIVVVVVVVKPNPYTQPNGLTCPHIIHRMNKIVREDKTYFRRLLAETGELMKRNL
jgi:hypothetical protein